MSSSKPNAATGAGRPRSLWQRRDGWSVVAGWVVTRLVLFAFMATFESFVVGDVFYYWRKISAMFSVGLPATLNEYPTPVAWVLSLPYLVTLGSRTGYLVAYIVFMAVLDIAFTVALFRAAGRKRDAGVDFWLGFIVLVGPLTYLRFDLIPAVLAGGALLLARTRPWVAGALTGLGAALKLWPALLYVALLAPRRKRGPLTLGFWAVGLGLALLSVVLGGFRRLISPLTWQSDRGLQVESVWASPLMVARMLHPQTWLVDISRYQAYEIFGPGVSTALVVATVVMVAGLILIALLFLRAFRAVQVTPRAVGLLMVAVTVIMIVTNKTLSPQYLLWLGGAVAALLVIDRRRGPTSGPDRDSVAIDGLARQLLILALLTHLVYPVLYDGLLGSDGHTWLVVATVVTTLRNLLLVVFSIASCRAAWAALGPARRFEPELPTL